jgi:hypothetical protein
MKLFALLLLVTTTAACVHPAPNPGTVLVSCATDATKDPKLMDALLEALGKANFMAAITSLIDPALGWTAEVVACTLHSFLGKVSATPTNAVEREHARAYLRARGYQVP